MKRVLVALTVYCLLVSPVFARTKKDRQASQTPAEKVLLSSETFSGIPFRGIGPAITSGRIADIAVDPRDPSIWFVASAAGGVFKTENAGVSFQPVFDDAGSSSIGCVAIAPSNSLVVWVGSGENNSQRSVGYGDGVYKSIDGGESFLNVGLKDSEHIGKIIIDPRDENTVFIAAQGPLWRAGGDRGLYKTNDGGKTFKKVLEISDDTGISDLVMDPRNPDLLYASAYQRRRHVWTLINGGPESAIYKSSDGGETWTKLEKGLPSGDVGRIGLAISPANPDVVYALIEAAENGGFYRSRDAGASWEKRGDYNPTSAQYYQEIIADPLELGRVYAMDTWMQVTTDGGASFTGAGEADKHVDNHALWIDPEDTRHLIAGCDGGVYESFDRATTWRFMTNLPITQFYKVTADNDSPFYNVYAGTQDNATLGGPSRTTSRNGIVNADWFVTVFGDGFKTVVDPEDPNIVYSQWQYGGLVRFDKRSGEIVEIQPQPGKGENALRWNWDSALMISPHSATRLYFGANRLFRSDDRGDSWRPLGGDLTRQIDRNKLKVMGRVWSIDAVAKNDSTSFFGTIVSVSESPLVEGLLYVGTDDGLVQVSGDGGKNWTKYESFPAVPEGSYVNQLQASLHEVDTLYAAFNNHKQGDFTPYLLKSRDRGKTWTSIAGDLPERGSVYSIVEDHVNPKLLFAGTEFGVFFTVDGGTKWVQLSAGIPPVAARELDIQRRENDLVVGSFGRGIFILDDYTPLRQVSEEVLKSDALLFPVKKTLMFMPSAQYGLPGKAFQGSDFYTAPNPPYGAVFTYYLKEGFKTLKAERKEREKAVEDEGGTLEYPSWEDLRLEAAEPDPAVVLTIRDRTGQVIRRLTGPADSGFHRVSWDLRFPPSTPARLDPPPHDPWGPPPSGPMVAPGEYTVSLARLSGGSLLPLAEAQSFETVPLGRATLEAKDKQAVLAFERKTADLQRAVLGAGRVLGELDQRLKLIRRALLDTPAASESMLAELATIEDSLRALHVRYGGDSIVRSHNEPDPPGIRERVLRIVKGQWHASSAPTKTHVENYTIAAGEFADFLVDLRRLVDDELAALERRLDSTGAPWTPGRIPIWQP